MDFYSHPEFLLTDHLLEVARRASDYFFFTKYNDILKNIAYIIGITHDFGKFTTFFQKKLLDETYNPKYTDHSLISSLFTAYLIQKNMEDFQLEDKIKKYIPLISFFVVIHHHSDLRSLEYLEDILQNEENKEKIKIQLEDLLKNRIYIDFELNKIGLKETLEDFSKSYELVIEELLKEIYYYKKEQNETKLELSFILLSLFSSLIDADKRSAGKIEDIDRVKIPENLIDIYKTNKFKNTEESLMNEKREEIYNKVINKVEYINLENRIYTLTAPTGSGKTLTAFSFAFKLREKIEDEFGYMPRIIYSLPFIAIINQNFQVLDECLNLLEDYPNNKSKYLIAHHHLANMKYKEGNEYKEIEESLELVESWESEIVVTTFVQFLETLIGFKNRFFKKLHNISRSIIILDEVQNIPVEYWNLIEKILYYLTNYLCCYIILMTATKPLIFKNFKSSELLDNYEEYFKYFNRVRLNINFNINTLDDLFNFFEDIYQKNKSKSFLFVFNTINSSIDFYNRLKKYLKNKANIFYLSSNIIPKHRILRINEIKKKLSIDEQVILVSTQVVEAGVDLDFDIGIRDIGPLDSIIQVSGRCNREFKNNISDVYLVNLKNENGKNFANMVYGLISPSICFNLLKEKNSIKEEEFLELIDQYFIEIIESKSQEDSTFIFESFLNLRFYDKEKILRTTSDFQLVKSNDLYPIFIEIDNKGKGIWEKYIEIKNNDKLKPWEKKIKIYEFKNDFENYIVSVRLNDKNYKIFDIDSEGFLGHVKKCELDKYYDLETGFKKQEGIELIW